MKIDAAGATHIGLVREHNEDSLHCGRQVFAVADGLGGHAGGEVASALAIQPLAALDGAGRPFPGANGQALADAVQAANTAVLDRAQQEPALHGMGTTLTAAALAGDELHLAHVGDSRAYLLRDGSFEQLTTDHAVGPYTLTRVVGLQPRVEVDRPPAMRLRAGDRLLLCSDGLTAVVGDDELAAALADGPAQDVAAKLVELALRGGGPDNVAVVVLVIEG